MSRSRCQATTSRLHLRDSPNGHALLAVIEPGSHGPTGFVFGSGRHQAEEVHLPIPGSTNKIRTRVGILAIGPDGITIGRAPEAMDHQLTVVRPGQAIPEILTSSPTRSSFAGPGERTFLDDHLVIGIEFSPYVFSFEVIVDPAPWASRRQAAPPRPYQPTVEDHVALLAQAIVQPALGGDPPRLQVTELAAVLGWSARKVASVGQRAHAHYLGDPAAGDRRRLTRLADHLLSRGIVSLADIERTLQPYLDTQQRQRSPDNDG